MATNKDILEKLDSLNELLVKMRTENATRDAEIKRISCITDQNMIDIKGNGKPGLEARLAIQEEREAKRDRREWLFTSVIVAQAIALIATMIFKL